MSLERADKKTGWVGKMLIVHLPISVTKWVVWMASLIDSVYFKHQLCDSFWPFCEELWREYQAAGFLNDH